MRSSSGAGMFVAEVRGADEEHLGEIEGHAEVVIDEAAVLRRVEHLEERRRRVALVRDAELVDLVEEEDRVLACPPAGCPRGRAPASRRRRCGGGRGCPPRRARRRARRARSGARARARSTRRPRSCPSPAGRGRAGLGRATAAGSRARRRRRDPSRSLRTARNSSTRSFTSARPWWSGVEDARAPRRGRRDRRVRACQGRSATHSSQLVSRCASGEVSRPDALEPRRDRGAPRPAPRRAGPRPRGAPSSRAGRVAVLLLAELLLDRLELLAQVELALPLADLLLDADADLLLRVGDPDLPVEVAREHAEPLLDRERLEERLLLRRSLRSR